MRWKIRIHYVRNEDIYLIIQGEDSRYSVKIYLISHPEWKHSTLSVPKGLAKCTPATCPCHGEAAHSTGKSLHCPSLKLNEIECWYWFWTLHTEPLMIKGRSVSVCQVIVPGQVWLRQALGVRDGWRGGSPVKHVCSGQGLRGREKESVCSKG